MVVTEITMDSEMKEDAEAMDERIDQSEADTQAVIDQCVEATQELKEAEVVVIEVATVTEVAMETEEATEVDMTEKDLLVLLIEEMIEVVTEEIMDHTEETVEPLVETALKEVAENFEVVMTKVHHKEKVL